MVISAQMLEQDRSPSGILCLRMARSQQRNALNRELLARLQEALADDEARVVLLEGRPHFSAGADLKERRELTTEQRTSHTDAIFSTAQRLADHPSPTLAFVSGYCLAGGAELALGCDIRVADESAIFGFPEVQLGIFPGAGGPVRLTRLLGPGRAHSLLYTGRRIDAQEAWRLGLVDAVGPYELALDWAERIAAHPSGGVRALKAALRASRDLPEAEAQAVVRDCRRGLDSSQDYQRSLQEFS